MKRVIAMVAAVILVMALSACGDAAKGTYIGKDPMETRTYSLSDFENFSIANDFDGTITKGDEYSVKVTTNADVFDKIYVDTEGDTLIARNAEGIVLEKTKITIEITCPKVVDFTLSNDADIILNGEFVTTNNVSVKVSNDASLNGGLSGDSLNVMVSNDGMVNLFGSFDNAVITASNDGIADLSNAEVSSAIISVENDAKVDILSLGDVEITGYNSAVVNVCGGNVIEKSVDEDVIINEME